MTGAAAAGVLAALSVDAAVGADQRGGVVVGLGGTWVTRLPCDRQAVQDYGLGCE